MISQTIGRLSKRIGVQLTIWYTGLFVISAILLIVLPLFLIQTYLVSRDKDVIQDRVQELQVRYTASGLGEAIDEVKEESGMHGREPIFVRISDRDNLTVFETQSEVWTRFNPSRLEDAAFNENVWTHLQAQGDEDALDIYSVGLGDGYGLEVGKSSEDRNGFLERIFTASAIVCGAAIILGLGTGIYLSVRTLRPIRILIRTVRSIGETGNLDNRVPTRGNGDELDELAVLFNRMVDRINGAVTGMENALDNVAHDLRTPMTRLRHVAESALQGKASEIAYRDALADCLEESDRVLVMLKTLMDISEAENGILKLTTEPVNVADILRDVADLYEAVAEDKSIALRVMAGPLLVLNADPTRLRQALANVVDNAVKYTPSEGWVSIGAERKDGYVEIRVEDSGLGIPPEEIEKIWDRLYRGDKSRALPGLGLGLSLVKAIVVSHGGSVVAETAPGKGAMLRLLFPAT